MLQTPNVYTAEIIDDSNRPSSGVAGTSTTEGTLDKKFMFTAVTGANIFLMGDTLPKHTITYKHFTGDQFRKPLLMRVNERWDELHLFKKDVAKPTSPAIMYIAVPYFDLHGHVRGYVAADNLRMRPDQVKHACIPFFVLCHIKFPVLTSDANVLVAPVFKRRRICRPIGACNLCNASPKCSARP